MFVLDGLESPSLRVCCTTVSTLHDGRFVCIMWCGIGLAVPHSAQDWKVTERKLEKVATS